MASPSTYSSNSKDHKIEIPNVSRLAKGKRKVTEQSQSSKDVRRSTKKLKFQSSLEQTDKYPITKLLLPRYIDFEDPQFYQVCSRLLDIFRFQRWIDFLSSHRVYYPRLVSEFFQNFQSNEKKSKFWSFVKGIKIKVSVRAIRELFKLQEGGVDEWSLDYDLAEAFSLMTDLPVDSASCITLLTGFNTNSFPPIQRLLHHIFTTIITPQGGGRCRLTET